MTYQSSNIGQWIWYTRTGRTRQLTVVLFGRSLRWNWGWGKLYFRGWKPVPPSLRGAFDEAYVSIIMCLEADELREGVERISYAKEPA